ncbi:MAG TPA: VWA domain-containing protein [Cytophagaceae bacterium]|nr:VWA domain-containing protein [Cytophagaceae bacterium]
MISLPTLAQIQEDTAISMTASLDNIYLCPDKNEVYFYIELNGSGASKRLPLNISLVLDRSGSMEQEERMHNAKIAVNYLIDHLNPNDIVSIVAYDHIAMVLHGSEPVTDKEHLKKKIHRIFPGGTTNISGGLEKGYAEVNLTYSKDRINRVLLLSDGKANEGITEDYLLDLIVKDHSQKQNISLSTFGLGHEFNETLMHDMAESGGGNYYFIETAPEALRDFEQEIKLLLTLVARNASLKINFPAQYLKLGKVYGFPYTANGNQINIDLKEVHPNEINGILLKFTVVAPLPDKIKLDARLSYDNTDNLQHIEKSKEVTLMPSFNKEDCKQTYNVEVLKKIAYFGSNTLLDAAIIDVENDNLPSARKKIGEAKIMLNNSLELPGDNSKLQNQYNLVNEYEENVAKHNTLSKHHINLLHKRMRHKNYKLRKYK